MLAFVDALISFEMTTGRKWSLLLISSNQEEKIFMTMNGTETPADLDPRDFLGQALEARKRDKQPKGRGKKFSDWHMHKACNDALIKLDDALGRYEMFMSDEITLMFVPHNSDERIHISQGGKPLGIDSTIPVEEVLAIKLNERGEGGIFEV